MADKTKQTETLHAASHVPKEVPRTLDSLKEWMDQAGNLVLSPSSYPVFSFFRDLKKTLPADPLVSQLGNAKIDGHEIGKLIPLASMLDRVIEGHWECLRGCVRRSLFADNS